MEYTQVYSRKFLSGSFHVIIEARKSSFQQEEKIVDKLRLEYGTVRTETRTARRREAIHWKLISSLWQWLSKSNSCQELNKIVKRTKCLYIQCNVKISLVRECKPYIVVDYVVDDY